MTPISMCRAYCRTAIRARIGDERGASFVEYALLLALVAIVCVAAVTVFGNETSDSFSSSASRLDVG